MSDYDDVRSELRGAGVRPNKELGQNFLSSGGVPQLIVQFARPTNSEHIVEIGPGLGALSGELVPHGLRDAIEYDEALATLFAQRFPMVRLHHADARNFDYASLCEPPSLKLTVFGNLPYSFTSEILFTLLGVREVMARAIVMVQKEVAARIASGPGVKKYGALSVAVQLLADVRLGPIIGPENFYPRPSVDSQVIELRFLEAPRYEVGDLFFFRRLVQGVFSHRRKKLLNALVATAMFKSLDVGAQLSDIGVSPERRPETLELEEFAVLSRGLMRALGAEEASS